MPYSKIPTQDIVTLHAVERYTERVMEFETTRDRRKIEAIASLILRILLESHPEALKIGNGEFKIPDEEFKICMQDGYITTVKKFECETAKSYYGGVMKSGRKIKKRKKSHVGPREKTNPVHYNPIWEQDW